MLQRIAWSIVLILPLLVAVGCGSASVEYPENPTPPPAGDPVSTSTAAPDQGG
jgi:hypothetical protein